MVISVLKTQELILMKVLTFFFHLAHILEQFTIGHDLPPN